MPSHYLLLFAKYPYRGKAKTRLEPALGAENVQAFATIALFEVLQYFGQVSGIKVANLTCKCVWCFAPSTAHNDVHRFLDEHNLSSQWEVWPQDDEASDLGDRLSAAVQNAASESEVNFKQTCTLIGSDCFHLMTSHIIAGITKASNDTPFLLPASDGGYVQLSLPLPISTSSFDNIKWSTAQTANDQVIQLQRIGHHVEVGKTLSDMDEPEDLQLFLADEGQAHLQAVYPRTLAFVRQHLAIR